MSASSGTSFTIPVCPWATPMLRQACLGNYTNLGNSLARKVNSICVCGSVRQHIWEPSLSCTHGSQWEGALHICLQIQHAVGHKARIISILQKWQLITWRFNLTSKVAGSSGHQWSQRTGSPCKRWSLTLGHLGKHKCGSQMEEFPGLGHYVCRKRSLMMFLNGIGSTIK